MTKKTREVSTYVYKTDEGDVAVRSVTINGELWLVAKDLVEAVDAGWDGHAIDHVPAEWKGWDQIPTLGGAQKMALLHENGANFYLIRSDKPKALPIQKWLAGEVIPSIRRTGQYSLRQKADSVLRGKSKVVRKGLTNAMKHHGCNKPWHYAHGTDQLYRGIWNRSTQELKEWQGLPRDANVRDEMSPEGLAMVVLGEYVATRRIEKHNPQNYIECGQEIHGSGRKIRENVAKAIASKSVDDE